MDAAIASADPALCVPNNLPARPKGRTLVIGAGKASAAMARAFDDHWAGEVSGLVVTRYGYALPCRRIEIVEAAHPVPDAAGEAAARRMLALVQNLSADDLVVCLMSGGASALLSLPAAGLTLADKQAINRALLRSGATIHEMNCVRKHLSAIKGGRLAAAAWPARLVTLAISDVPGDDISVVGSGPTVADPTTAAQARAILERYRIAEPHAAIAHIARGHDETPKPGDPRLSHASARLIAAPREMLEVAAAAARARGVHAIVLGDALQGEARELAAEHAVLADKIRRDRTVAKPCVLLSGGETTVTLRGAGRGGRNSEYLLGLAVALAGAPDIYALACDTDGIDGSEDNAGAIVRPDTLARAAARGADAGAYLDNNDAYGFFAAIGDLVMTGPTRTNVNDFRAILIQAR
ncbi:MAG: glycerate kinase [Alphaproteobacteria bacterium]